MRELIRDGHDVLDPRSKWPHDVAAHDRVLLRIFTEFWSRFHSESKRIRSGFESKRRESPRIHNVFANFGRVFTVIHCETLSWEVSWLLNALTITVIGDLLWLWLVLICFVVYA